MNTLYLECQSGISGDMTVAALLDLGADEAVLRQSLASLGVDGYAIAVSRVQKAGIDACDFDVQLDSEQHAQHNAHNHHHGEGRGCGKGKGQGHGMGCCGGHHHAHEEPCAEAHGHDHHNHDASAFAVGHGPLHGMGHAHGDEHGHHHTHEHEPARQEHSHSHGGHVHRSLGDIVTIIEQSAITDRAKAMSIKIFTVVAQAEAKVHGKPVDQVHFHEVGAVDSIVDIVGAAVCLDNLGIERILCSPLREGTGTVKCQHGIIPVPAPATLEIAASHGVPLLITDTPGELVTPTGAAIVAALADSFQRPGPMTVLRTGYGAGKRDYKHTANLLRASLIREETPASSGEVVKLECNLDDMTGEELAYACEKLLEAGALDVWCTPILMKKGRPAQMLSVLAPTGQQDTFANLVLRHTSTIGVRVSHHTRHVLDRRILPVNTPYGEVLVKESSGKSICKTQVEYESAKSLADAKNVPINQIFRQAYNGIQD